MVDAVSPIANEPCQCGSGLTAGRCCAFDPVAADPAAEIIAELGPTAAAAAEALRSGDREKAADLAIAVLERAPRMTAALAVLAEIRMGEGRLRAAKTLFDRLMEVEPSNFWPINKLGLLELGRGNAEAAEALARRGIRIAPENPQAHNLMGMTMTELHRAVVGEYHCRRALELLGKRPVLLLANLATNLFNQGRIEEARDLYREAAAADPRNRQVLVSWARMEEADRKFTEAHALLDRLDRLAPHEPGVTLARATTLGREKKFDQAITVLETAASRASRDLRPVELLERGRLLDKVGRYDEAWADFRDGKRRLAELTGQTYRREDMQEEARDLRTFFTRERLALLPRAGIREDTPQPLFILGFPRSGTTLLEQTLTTSPDIAAGDELVLVHEVAELAPQLLNSPWKYPGALTELWMGDRLEGMDTLRDHYLQRVRQLGVMRTGARFFTDKMPLNETHLGLIALMFPRAPLLHLIRHPLDIMVSAMSNVFTHGGFCGSALESAAEHLVLSHDLVAHYRAEMDLNYRPIRYEDLVDDQEATVRGVFAFVGVPFHPATLSQETNPRYARTASYAQVTEKLYDQSRYRYRHYLRHLAPALPILAPLIARLGYVVEELVK